MDHHANDFRSLQAFPSYIENYKKKKVKMISSNVLWDLGNYIVWMWEL